MGLALSIGLIGLVVLVTAVFDALYMMRLRQITGTRPGLRETADIALGRRDVAAPAPHAARLALFARAASFAGIAVLMVLLIRL